MAPWQNHEGAIAVQFLEKLKSVPQWLLGFEIFIAKNNCVSCRFSNEFSNEFNIALHNCSLQWKSQSQGAIAIHFSTFPKSVPQWLLGSKIKGAIAIHTIEREGASVTLFNFWKFSNVIFSNFPIQRIPVLVKNSGGIYRRCYFCLIRTPKVKKKAQWTILSPMMTERSHSGTKSHWYIL